jgi:hypothetical protein
MRPKSIRQPLGLIAVCVGAVMLGGCNMPGRAAVTPTPTAMPSATPAPAGTAKPAAPRSAQDILAAALQEPHDTVESSDGKAELLIPKGALPSGVTPEQIKISLVPAAQLTLPAGMNPPKLAYQLEPNGLQFSTPALFHISLPTGAHPDMPIPLLQSGDKVSLIDEAAVELDQGSGQTTLVASIPHFSDLLVYGTGVIAGIANPKDQLVGESFLVDVSFAGTYPVTFAENSTDTATLYTTGAGAVWSSVPAQPKGPSGFFAPLICESAANDATVSFYDSVAITYATLKMTEDVTLVSKPFKCSESPAPGIQPPPGGAQPPPPKKPPSEER